MNKLAQCGLALAILVTSLVTDVRAADPIADLNAIAQSAIKAAQHPLPATSVEYAIVHLAIYDAVESIDQRYTPYYAYVPGASGSMAAADAKAEHDALTGLFGASSAIDAAYSNFLTTYGIDASDPGIAVGSQAAAAANG